MLSPDEKKSIGEALATIKVSSLVMPALIGSSLGAGAGGAAGLSMSPDRISIDETPEEARRRKVRTALMMASMGGAAGAALPTGYRMIAGQEERPSLFTQGALGAAGTALDLGTSNEALAAAIPWYALSIRKNLNTNRAYNDLSGMIGKGKNAPNPATLLSPKANQGEALTALDRAINYSAGSGKNSLPVNRNLVPLSELESLLNRARMAPNQSGGVLGRALGNFTPRMNVSTRFSTPELLTKARGLLSELPQEGNLLQRAATLFGKGGAPARQTLSGLLSRGNLTRGGLLGAAGLGTYGLLSALRD